MMNVFFFCLFVLDNKQVRLLMKSKYMLMALGRKLHGLLALRRQCWLCLWLLDKSADLSAVHFLFPFFLFEQIPCW